MRARSAVLLGVCVLNGSPGAVAPPIAGPNDNRTPAGVVTDSGVTLTLEARRVMWHPDGDSLRGRSTEAFAEVGKAPTVPGPLLRVRAGTPVRIRVRNHDLPDTMRLFLPNILRGDTLTIPPGEEGELRYTPQVPGNYFYRAVTGGAQSQFFQMRGLLAGAFIVDSATAEPRADRIFVVNWLVDSLTPDGSQPQLDRTVFAINGRSWPHTERLTATVGDSLKWRIINLNTDVHPMHLHGVYFRVDEFLAAPAQLAAKGPQPRMAVTEFMPSFSTMSLTWSPERAGNWLFHCHFAFHLIPPRILEKGADGALARLRDEGQHAHENHAMTGMSGLVMGITVNPRAGARATDADPPRRRLRLVAVSDTGHADTLPSLRFRLEEPRARTRTEARIGFSPAIVVTKGEPVSIMVVNTMTEPTAVHWHGIELESYYDGVAGFGGVGRRISPMIAPRDSFEARFTPPRSGTFIYHSHINEVRQHAAGLVGALIVRDGNAPLENDHVIFIKAPQSGPGNTPLEINGQLNPDTIVFRVGVPQRIRLISLAAFNPNATVWLTTRPDSSFANRPDSLVVQWRPVAKDGADLPASARTPKLARQLVSMGETYDFEYTPTSKGLMRIEVRPPGAAGSLLARIPIRVE
jgi:FtsP/CotA-like multicopper oxidase with cupredoxin domain